MMKKKLVIVIISKEAKDSRFPEPDARELSDSSLDLVAS